MRFHFALLKNLLVNKMPRNDDFRNFKKDFYRVFTGFPRGEKCIKKMHFFSVFCFGIEYNFNYELIGA